MARSDSMSKESITQQPTPSPRPRPKQSARHALTRISMSLLFCCTSRAQLARGPARQCRSRASLGHIPGRLHRQRLELRLLRPPRDLVARLELQPEWAARTRENQSSHLQPRRRLRSVAHLGRGRGSSCHPGGALILPRLERRARARLSGDKGGSRISPLGLAFPEPPGQP